MLRLLLALAFVGAAPAIAQPSSVPIGPGTRVRVFFPPETLPPHGLVFSGALVSTGDTLVIDTDGGSTLRVAPRDLAGFDVSAGRRPFPYWVPALGAVAGLASGYGAAQEVARYQFCDLHGCLERQDKAKGRIIMATGLAVGALVGTYLGTHLSSERWVPVSRVAITVTGVALSARL